MHNRSLRFRLLQLLLLALLAWLVLLVFAYYVPPHAFMAFVVFLLLLMVAQIGTFSILIYLIGRGVFSSPLYQTSMRPAIRQGALLSLVVVFNLILRALSSWSIIMAIVIFVAAVVVEILSLARK